MKRPVKCNDCKAPILLVRKADPQGRSVWAVLDADPLDPERQHDGHRVRVIDDNRAYTIAGCREHLELQTGILLRPRDVTHIEDLPWHYLHDCPNRKARR